MNARQRLFRLFAGEPSDRLLVQPICMTFAARLAAKDYYSYVTDYRVLVEAQLRTMEAFGLDIVTLCSDPCREAVDCGAQVRWFADQPPAHDPLNPPIRDKSQLIGKKQPDPLGGGRMHDRVKGAERFAQEVGGDVPILGWVEGPMAEAADLRGMTEAMLDLVDDPGFVLDLFEFITEMETNFALAQIEAGADVIGIGDAAASLVSPDLYRAYILPYERRIIEAIRATGTPVRLHICGNTNHLLRDIATLDMEMIDIDCLTDLRRAREEIPADVAILGNVDPVRCLLEGEPEEVARAFADCYETVGDRYVVGPGCEVPPLTPHDNVRAMVEWARR